MYMKLRALSGQQWVHFIGKGKHLLSSLPWKSIRRVQLDFVIHWGFILGPSREYKTCGYWDHWRALKGSLDWKCFVWRPMEASTSHRKPARGIRNSLLVWLFPGSHNIYDESNQWVQDKQIPGVHQILHMHRYKLKKCLKIDPENISRLVHG